MAKVDLGEVNVQTSPNSEMEYVTIPERDLFDMPHPNIQLNNNKYGPGTHHLTKLIALYVKDRLKAYERGNVRLMRNIKDSEAETLMQRGFNASGSVGAATTNF